MQLFPSPKIVLSIGPLNLTWYATFIAIAAYLCYKVSENNIKKMGYSSELAEDLFFGMLPFALIGARTWYVVFEWGNQYASNPISALYIWEGGLGIYGGVLGGLAYGYYFAKKHKLSYLRWGDAVVPNLLLAQTIGRWGNFMNQEAYGRIVSEAYYTYFPEFIKAKMFINGAYREPTFLYESIANLTGFLLITFVYKKVKERKRGDLLYAYFAWYGVTRFFIEGLRSDSLYIGPFRVSQVTSVILMSIGILGILGVFRKQMAKRKPVLLFDVDGTLIDSDELIFDSFRYVFGKYEPQLQLTPEILLSFLGPSLRSSFEKYSDKDPDMLCEEYRVYNAAKHNELLKPIPHVKEMLQYFKDQGYTLGAVSTKFTKTVMLGLSVCEIQDYFDVIIGGDMVEHHKPDPEGIYKACKELGVSHDFLIYVGDSPSDIAAAHNAGAYSVAAGWTAKGKEVYNTVEPERIIDDLLEMKEVVKEVVYGGD